MGLEVYTPFKKNSFDKPLLTALLRLNELSEKPLIEYALSLQSLTTNFLRQQKYPLEDYLNGVALEMMPLRFAERIIGSLMVLGFFNKLSQSSPGDELFMKTLEAIDATQNARMAAIIYLAHGGFPKTSKEMEQLIKEELQRAPRMLASDGRPVLAFDILGTIKRYAEHDSSYYSSSVTILLYPFFIEENNPLLPETFQELAKRELAKGVPFKPGQWLTFKP